MGALDDVTVVELSIAIAGPSCGRALAYHGADVTKIESRVHPDLMRMFGSAWAVGEDPDVYADTSPYLGEFSANKRSVGLDLKAEAGRETALALLAGADVFLTNYSAPAIASLGLGYDEVRAVNPRIVYVALPGFGSDPSSPYYEFLAWGPNQAPLVGLDALTGHPDRDPAGVATFAVPDYFAGLHALTAVLTGLEHCERTGWGAFVDLAQFEATVGGLGPFLFDHALSGRSPSPSGNRLEWVAPQGCYPCRGDDSWVAISVTTDEQWAALAGVLGGGADHARFATRAGRSEAHDELDKLIGAWTSTRSPAEAAAELQAVGVPAYGVLDATEVLHDPQVRDRRWFQVQPSTRFPGGDLFSGHPIRLDATPGQWWRAGPTSGEDTVSQLTTRYGLDPDAVDALLEQGAAFTPAATDVALERPYLGYLEILLGQGNQP